MGKGADKLRNLANSLLSIPDRISIAPAVPELTKIVETAASEQILSGGSRGKSKYKEIAPSTLRQRQRRKINSASPLVGTGILLKYIENSAKDTIADDGKKVAIGYPEDTELGRIAAIQQSGSKDQNHPPSRKIVKLTAGDKKEAREVIGKTATKQVNDIIGDALKK